MIRKNKYPINEYSPSYDDSDYDAYDSVYIDEDDDLFGEEEERDYE